MSGTIEVDYTALQRSAAAWSSVAEKIEGAALRLGLVTGGGLSPLVAAEVDRFALQWQSEVRALGVHARSGGEAFTAVSWDFRYSDERGAQHIGSLMPWTSWPAPNGGR